MLQKLSFFKLLCCVIGSRTQMNEFCEDKLQMDWQVKTGDHTVRQ